jgi:tetratricopeptide (TPR) repeat protein
MPGQKLWLWALSREGGVWEELLTDTDGQYVEYQAGRLFVQYAPGNDVNPIKQAGFDPGTADRWTETWFPVEGLGGLTDVSREGAMHVRHEGERLTVSVHAFGNVVDTLRISSGDHVVASIPITFVALEPVERTVDLAAGSAYRIELPALRIDYSSDAGTRALARPFATDPSVIEQTPAADRWIAEARELAKGRRYAPARTLFEQALAEEPWNRAALLGLADLEYRSARYEQGLAFVTPALELDAYDAAANFTAGNLYRALGRTTDAREAYGWAVRSMAYRSVAYVQLAELAFHSGDYPEAVRYAQFALDYDRYNLPARQVLAMVGRKQGDQDLVASMRQELFGIDPLHHFAAAEVFLATPGSASAEALTATLRSEYPDQTVLELAIDYVRRGATTDAARMLDLGTEVSSNPLLRAWRGYLDGDASLLAGGADPRLVFPFRRETLPVLRWAAERDGHWSWNYLLALNLWALNREEEAAALLVALGDQPDFAPLYVARAYLLNSTSGQDPEADLRRAVQLDNSDRTIRIRLVRYLQDTARWEDALVESAAGQVLFPDDFNLALLHVRSLNELGRSREALDILNSTHVLPSENARTSHRMYEQAHTLAALGAMERGAFADAQVHLQAALDWPEHLGQGRPYDPDERLVRYLLGVVAGQLGEVDEAGLAFEAVVDASNLTGASLTALDLLAIPSLAALGRTDAFRPPTYDPDAKVGAFAAGMTRALAAGENARDTVQRLAAEYPDLFADLDGRILLQALLMTP